MKITLIQPDLLWENVKWNLSHLYNLVKISSYDTDIVLLPEMFNTGFTMKSPDFAEALNGPTHQWMIDLAKETNSAISGSLIIKEDGNYFNRLLFVEPEGKTSYYDKRHLFRMGKENLHFCSGKKNQVIDYKGLRISSLICYDLRFPVWSRNTDSYDLLCYHSNWPASRDNVWQSLLKARAIENQCYVAGINRIGLDGEGVNYVGNSQVIDPKGNVMSNLGSEENVQTISLDLTELKDFRKKFPVWMDADEFKIK